MTSSNKMSTNPTRDEMADAYRRRATAFAALIEGTAPDRWSSPSPCEGWLARDVVAHVVDFSAHVLGEQGLSDPPQFADFDDPAAAFNATREVVQGLLDNAKTTDKEAGKLHWELTFDLAPHSWDLAVATGQDATMAPDYVEFFGEWIEDPAPIWDWQRSQGWFAPIVPVAEDAPLQDRVLGFLGRDPRWTPPTREVLA